MRVLAIDPGNVRSAYVVIERLSTAISEVTGTKFKIHDFGIMENELLLGELINQTPAGVTLAIEMVQSFGMAVGAEVFETVFWIGRFVQAWDTEGRKWDRVYRKDVKMHLCGSMRAKDPNIRQALIDKIGPQGTKKSPGPTYGISKDVWSALAVGVTWLETRATKD